MEVYAVTREFTEWGKGFYNRLPVPVRNGLRAAGVCHYLVVVRDPNKGEIYSFDFGPVGGDVTGRLAGGSRRSIDETPTDVIKSQLRKSQSEPSLATIAAIERAAVASADGGGGSAAGGAAAGRGAGGMRRSASTVRALSSARGKKPPTVGEIRERKLEALPEGVHFVGHSDLTLDDIRRFNAARCTNYSLHANDCRHYVDDLCAHACPDAAERYRRGVASRVSWQQTWGRVKSGRPHEALYVMPLQLMADVNNIPAINRIRSACSASFVFGLGMRAIPFLCKPVAPVAAALGVVKTPPARRIVTTAAGAVAGVSSEVPVVRERSTSATPSSEASRTSRDTQAAGANLFSTSARRPPRRRRRRACSERVRSDGRGGSGGNGGGGDGRRRASAWAVRPGARRRGGVGGGRDVVHRRRRRRGRRHRVRCDGRDGSDGGGDGGARTGDDQ